jgi:hypothetical protein
MINKMAKKINIEGWYVRKDLEEIVSESFVKRYDMRLDNWIEPFGYYDERGQSILTDGPFPDGTYVLLGKVSYPGEKRKSRFHIGQFNLAKSQGLDLTWAFKFRRYPELPPAIEDRFNPTFPLVRVGEVKDYARAKNQLTQLDRPLTAREISSTIKTIDEGSVEARVCKLRLAFQELIDKEK